MRRAVLAWMFTALGLLLATPACAADTVFYYSSDTLHSEVVVTDQSRNVVERTHYAPYGQVLDRDLRDGPGYTGHEEDPETNLVYMQQRYYDRRPDDSCRPTRCRRMEVVRASIGTSMPTTILTDSPIRSECARDRISPARTEAGIARALVAIPLVLVVPCKECDVSRPCAVRSQSTVQLSIMGTSI